MLKQSLAPTRMAILACGLLAFGCQGWDDSGRDELDVSFDIPRGEEFPASLSAYELFDEPMADLVPSGASVEYELASPLFTDYSRKQRLLKLPPGGTMEVIDGLTSRFPEGTVVAKTFYYPLDFADESLGWEVIETRVMVMREGEWNVATYIWNESQTDAALSLDGAEMLVRWASETGQERATDYEIPNEIACVTCHQRDGAADLIGLRPRNLNIDVRRDGAEVNQIEYLRSRSLLSGAAADTVTTIPAYEDPSNELELRARAYLDANCAHCHNPSAWHKAAKKNFDFRYATPLDETGILDERHDFDKALLDGEMPLTGTTLIHEEGLDIVFSYLDTL